MKVDNSYSANLLENFFTPEELQTYSIENALIKDVRISIDADRGFIMAWVECEKGDGSQEFGCHFLADTDPHNLKTIERYAESGKRQANWLGKFVRRTLSVVEAGAWEELKNKPVRLLIEDKGLGYIKGIGHFIRDKWFVPMKEFTESDDML